MFRTILALSLLMFACGDNILFPVSETCEPGGKPSGFHNVKLWIQDDPDVGQSQASMGCDLWQSKCYQCEMASESKAQAKIHVDRKACVANFPGLSYTLAYSEPEGSITLIIECMRALFPREADDTPSRKALAIVLGHELGHEAGMWWHVPQSCDENTVRSTFERDLIRQGICGQALMNAYIDLNVDAITDVDRLAFDIRDLGNSNFPHVAATESEHGCVLTYTPPAH